MASDKERRKADNVKKKAAKPAGPLRHPDGDRRRRGTGSAYRDAMAEKELFKKFGAVELPDDEPR